LADSSATRRISAWLTAIWAGYVGPIAFNAPSLQGSLYFAGIPSSFAKRLG
jgi:hypothetical protein